jgi:hypothetical protein
LIVYYLNKLNIYVSIPHNKIKQSFFINRDGRKKIIYEKKETKY